MNIILASQSPRRRKLISEVLYGVDFMSSDIDETIPEYIKSPQRAAEYLAEEKATAAMTTLNYPENTIVIGCDTIVVLDGKIYGKPEDETSAKRMLNELSGREHSVYTGVSIIDAKFREESYVEETKVFFNPLSDEQITEYVSTGDPLDKAGAYGIQNVPPEFINRIEGDYNNVVGLPIKSLLIHLSSFV